MTYKSWSDWYNDIREEDIEIATDTINFLEEKLANFKSDDENDKNNRKIERLELSIKSIKYYFSMK